MKNSINSDYRISNSVSDMRPKMISCVESIKLSCSSRTIWLNLVEKL